MTDLKKLKKAFDEIGIPYQEYKLVNGSYIELTSETWTEETLEIIFDEKDTYKELM